LTLDPGWKDSDPGSATTLPRTVTHSTPLYVSTVIINHCRTKEYLRSLKMNDECRALKFSKSGSQLFTHGDGGEVYIWDVRYLKFQRVEDRRCKYKYIYS
jgi:hypothetical protein